MELIKHPVYLQAAGDAVLQFKYGDLISFEWLYQNLKLRKPAHGTAEDFERFQFAFLSAYDGFQRELLEENQMMLVNVRGEGYRICEPEKQTSTAMNNFKKRVAREIRKAEDRLSNIRFEMLSDPAKNENMESLAKLAHLKSMTKRKQIA